VTNLIKTERELLAVLSADSRNDGYVDNVHRSLNDVVGHFCNKFETDNVQVTLARVETVQVRGMLAKFGCFDGFEVGCEEKKQRASLLLYV
jgi:hypothetical protein